jgi:predicted nucleic acid-binding Zn ribbon protein
MRNSAPRHLDDILSGMMSRWENQTAKKVNAVRDAWAKAVDEGALAHTQPVSCKKGELMVIVDNSVWLYKLTMEKKEIIRKFNENYPGRQKLSEIRYRVGKTDLS